MRQLYSIYILIILVIADFAAAAQNNLEDMKTALVYKIACNVRWEQDSKQDSEQYFTIGLLCEDNVMLQHFRELAAATKINNKTIKVVSFKDVKALEPVQLLYLCESFNPRYSSIVTKIGKHSTLLVSEEYDQPGDIMINLRVDKKNSLVTFEYNRANILFQGLDLSDKIVLLKGSEIEIRQLYLRVRELWDIQKAEVESLRLQSEIQNRKLKIRNDSLLKMKTDIGQNQQKIFHQDRLLQLKDSTSKALTDEIKNQRDQILGNRTQIHKLIEDLGQNENLVKEFKQTIGNQKLLSDSLSVEISQKKLELESQGKAIVLKETVIQKQNYMLLLSFIVIFVVLISIFLVYRALVANKKAKLKIAEQKEEIETALDKLKDAQTQLVQSEKMASLGILSAGIAHEINNPLNFIKGGALGIEKLIKKSDLKQNEKVDKLIEAVNVGITRATEIVSSLNQYSRSDNSEHVECDINNIIGNCLIMLQNKLKNKIEIIKDLTDQSYFFKGNEGKLHQVFLNIILNAEQAIESSGTIHIKTEIAQQQFIASVCDSGCGISPDDMQRIFDPFFTTKPPGQGTGLGLSITYRIIQEHKGSIEYQSQPGAGTTVFVKLPLSK
jgi:C4-dicarboxylate-specific signal transduction histidine kinase